jgi:hypothetical protein
MKNLGRTLLILGLVVLALLVGILVGRGRQRVEPTSGNATVQITTAPAAPSPPPTPLPALPPPQPQPAAIPKIAPDLQVQDDAAAVGMTTREIPAAEPPQTEPRQAEQEPPARDTASGDGAAPAPPPAG